MQYLITYDWQITKSFCGLFSFCDSQSKFDYVHFFFFCWYFCWFLAEIIHKYSHLLHNWYRGFYLKNLYIDWYLKKSSLGIGDFSFFDKIDFAHSNRANFVEFSRPKISMKCHFFDILGRENSKFQPNKPKTTLLQE